MRDRGKALEAPDWWLEIARAKVSDKKGLVDLGHQLSRCVGRSTPWSHTVLSRFANGEIQPTQELAEALSSHFAIPRPFYVPRDLKEAKAMQAIVEMRPPVVASTAGVAAKLTEAASETVPVSKFDDPVRAAREREHLAHLEYLEAQADRHRADIQSKDAPRADRRRGPRRIHRGR